jgi:peroxiredoxin (alkyl hydroperoxide reductase subunit C)
MAELPAGCGRTTGSVVGAKPQPQDAPQPFEPKKEMTMTARVGQKAPDFTVPAYYQGKFTSVKLSEWLDKWVMLCYYRGDFTFV